MTYFTHHAILIADTFQGGNEHEKQSIQVCLSSHASGYGRLSFSWYGLSIIDKYKDTGKKKLLLIHELTDETYSLVATTPVPDGVDKGWFYLFISMLDHVYWIIGCTFGALFGSLVNFNTKGVDFVMTALFIVIFTDQWLNSKNHIPAITGMICSVICLLLFGPDRFIIPAMLSILTILTLLRKPLEEHMEREDQKGDDSHA